MVILYGWEGNHMSGFALAMHHRHSGVPTYGLSGLGKGDEHQGAYAPLEYYGIFIPFLHTVLPPPNLHLASSEQ